MRASQRRSISAWVSHGTTSEIAGVNEYIGPPLITMMSRPFSVQPMVCTWPSGPIASAPWRETYRSSASANSEE